MKILITGGAGYIGSHTVVKLLEDNYDIVILDNLSNSSEIVLDRIREITNKDFSFYNTDLKNYDDVENIFKNEEISSVIHFAALKSVSDSVHKPIDYYENNISGSLNLYKLMDKYNVKNLIYSSSAAVYGEKSTPPYGEDSELSAINPYGETKIMNEKILKDISNSDPEWNIISLRYFNPLGAHKSGLIGEVPAGIPPNIFPYITQVAIGKLEDLKVFGNDYPTPDGTCIRDYIHVEDLAVGHIEAMEKLNHINGYNVYNLGTGKGESVLELIKAFEKANDLIIPFEIAGRREGDAPLSLANPDKAKRELGFEAKKTIIDMCRDGWNFQKKNPNGYK